MRPVLLASILFYAREVPAAGNVPDGPKDDGTLFGYAQLTLTF